MLIEPLNWFTSGLIDESDVTSLSINMFKAFVRYARPKYSFENVMGISGRKKNKSMNAHEAFLNINAG